MPYLVDGNSNVADVRGDGYKDEIVEVTGLAVATIRDAHGRTLLRNLFEGLQHAASLSLFGTE